MTGTHTHPTAPTLQCLRPAARLAAMVVVGLLAGAAPAAAHHRPGGPTSGLPIPALTHGQMQVVSDHRPEILALADAQNRTDPVFRRLHNFIALQHASCLWGVMPKSVSDESSPFNACMHADLAATMALLAHMRDMPAARLAADRIATSIAAETQARMAVLCRYSDEPFNTADVIMPDWQDVPHHGPTLALALAFGAFTAAGSLAVSAALRRSPATRLEGPVVS